MIIAPKPTLLNAEPNPGSQTAPSTFMSPAWAPRCAGTERSGVTSNTVMSGTKIVAFERNCVCSFRRNVGGRRVYRLMVNHGPIYKYRAIMRLVSKMRMELSDWRNNSRHIRRGRVFAAYGARPFGLRSLTLIENG